MARRLSSISEPAKQAPESMADIVYAGSASTMTLPSGGLDQPIYVCAPPYAEITVQGGAHVWQIPKGQSLGFAGKNGQWEAIE